MAKRNTYSPDFKVQVVEEYLSSKTSYRALTKKYNIPDTKSIREWIKKYNEFGEWGHDEIILEPTNKSYNSIIIDEVEADDFRVIGEFIGVLKEK